MRINTETLGEFSRSKMDTLLKRISLSDLGASGHYLGLYHLLKENLPSDWVKALKMEITRVETAYPECRQHRLKDLRDLVHKCDMQNINLEKEDIFKYFIRKRGYTEITTKDILYDITRVILSPSDEIDELEAILKRRLAQ